ncbi:CAZyme family CE10 [Penicillium robsamsonii]|uniref:CAZyme family CE10 n=1 Tax=Penicillium robsamsonii TaxID=1792511 RepID=UPI002546C1E7|nr:CAZyme family CE10 [Penicillium robsamsonii]KAJ5835745.1 CAZyme family CE10 [Penicillium robsamsonii]
MDHGIERDINRARASRSVDPAQAVSSAVQVTRGTIEKALGVETRGEITLTGLVVFYPSIDWTRTRIERDATNSLAAQKSTNSPSMYKFFDDSYLLVAGLLKRPSTGRVDVSRPYLSPRLAPASLLHAAYPPAVAIYTCGWDQLLGGFVEEGKMVSVGGSVVEDVIHVFDKKPLFGGKINCVRGCMEMLLTS